MLLVDVFDAVNLDTQITQITQNTLPDQIKQFLDRHPYILPVLLYVSAPQSPGMRLFSLEKSNDPKGRLVAVLVYVFCNIKRYRLHTLVSYVKIAAIAAFLTGRVPLPFRRKDQSGERLLVLDYLQRVMLLTALGSAAMVGNRLIPNLTSKNEAACIVCGTTEIVKKQTLECDRHIACFVCCTNAQLKCPCANPLRRLLGR
jgi:hypothetical protein